MASPPTKSSPAAIVLAAGRSTRMKSDVPKVIHDVLGEPMVGLVVDVARAAGADPVVVVVGPGEHGERIRATLQRRAEAAGVPAPRFAVQTNACGTADAFASAAAELEGFEGTALVLNGDVPLMRPETLARILDGHAGADAFATVLTFEPVSAAGYGRIVRGPEGSVVAIVEDKNIDRPEVRRIGEVNAGIYGFTLPEAFERAAAVGPDPVTGEHYLTSLIADAVTRDRPVVGVRAGRTDEVDGVNDRADLARVSATARDRVIARLQAEGVTVVDPATTWIDHRVTIGRDTTIHPFTVISGPTTIGVGCQVGPFSHVRIGTVLEDGAQVGNFVEMKKTRLGAGSKAKHLSYLGDGDIGSGANIGAGTVFANWDGQDKHETRIGDRAFVGSGTIIVAPGEVAAGARTGAGALLKRGSSVPAGETWVGVPARPIRKK